MRTIAYLNLNVRTWLQLAADRDQAAANSGYDSAFTEGCKAQAAYYRRRALESAASADAVMPLIPASVIAEPVPAHQLQLIQGGAA